MDSLIIAATSILGLLIVIIVEQKKLATFFDEQAKWLQQRNERKKASAFIASLANPHASDQKAGKKSSQNVPAVLQISIFLISIISSVILSFFSKGIMLPETIYGPYQIFWFGLGTYILVSIMPAVLVTIFIETNWQGRLAWFIAIVLSTVIMGLCWITLTFITVIISVQVLNAGFFSALLLSIGLWVRLSRDKRRG